MKRIITLSSILLSIDIIIKIIVNNTMKINQSIKIINNFFYLTYVRNTGAAWSILSGKQTFLIIITLIIIISLFIYIKEKKQYTKKEIISYSLIISGSIGNLIDRIIYNYVIDYLDFNIFNYNFPIFNFADTCIVIGIILLLIETYGGRKNGIKTKDK